MKRFHSICQGTNIQSQFSKQNTQQARFKLTTLIIDSYQVFIKPEKHLITSTNRTYSLKKSSFYHQFIHNFSKKRNQHNPVAHQNKGLCLNQNKRNNIFKITQRFTSTQKKRSEEQEFFFKLAGKTITKLNPQSHNSKRINFRRLEFSENRYSAMQQLSRNAQLRPKISTCPHQPDAQKYSPTLFKQYIRNDQGYCLFNKILNPLSTKRPTRSNKKNLFINDHNNLHYSKLSEKGKQICAINKIEGWAINSFEEEELL